MSVAHVVPQWMRLARRDVGTRERPGAEHSQTVLDYFKDVGHSGIRNDETAWCAAYVGSCLERAGIRSTRSLMARSYSKWGQALSKPRPGCIVVLSRTRSPIYGHVGFFVRETDDYVVLLGGNQSNAVNEKRFAKSRVVAWRWPSPRDVRMMKPQTESFEKALDHVLEFEGGFSDHHADPGGPTFRGVTIGLLASHLGTRISNWRRARLVNGIKGLKSRQVRMIYWQHFWKTTSAAQLPPGVALMVFDAAVQHGPRRAIRMLQRAVGVDDDGEIGPITRAAVARTSAREVVRSIGQARRAFYRSLKHFEHFGRGWMRRLDATIERGLARADSAPAPIEKSPRQSNQKDIEEMNNEKKWWMESLTLWGTFITAMSTVLPIIGPFIGFDISATMIEQFGDAVARLIQALGGVTGTFMAVVGRMRANAALTQRMVNVKL